MLLLYYIFLQPWLYIHTWTFLFLPQFIEFCTFFSLDIFPIKPAVSRKVPKRNRWHTWIGLFEECLFKGYYLQDLSVGNTAKILQCKGFTNFGPKGISVSYWYQYSEREPCKIICLDKSIWKAEKHRIGGNMRRAESRSWEPNARYMVHHPYFNEEHV